jgi:Caspase domain
MSRLTVPLRNRLAVLFLLVLGLAFVPAARASEADGWEPAKTWVVAVGVLEWQSKNFAPFPKTDRKDAELVELFKKKGVPAEQVVFLSDKEATRERIDKTLAEVLPKAKKDDLLVLYYAGHGGRPDRRATYFANYDAGDDLATTGWAVASIFDAIEKDFKGSRALLLADCCNSGALAEEAKKRKGNVSYAALTSVHVSGLSTEHWTFTESVLAGLDGDPRVDSDGDGTVTFEELAKFTEAEMAFGEKQMAAWATTGKFAAGTKLATAGKKADPKLGTWVDAPRDKERVPACVVGTKEGFYKVRFGPPDAAKEEWVPKEDVKALELKHFAVKEQVQVEWGAKWWPATVVEARHGLHLITYDGWDSSWDEWVPARRIKAK